MPFSRPTKHQQKSPTRLFKPSPNGLASRRKSTQVFELRSTCVSFGQLALILVQLKFVRKSTQVFFAVWPPIASPYLQTCVDLWVRLARTLRYHLSTSSRFLVRIRRRHQSFNANYQKKKASLYSKGKFNESSFSLWCKFVNLEESIIFSPMKASRQN